MRLIRKTREDSNKYQEFKNCKYRYSQIRKITEDIRNNFIARHLKTLIYDLLKYIANSYKCMAY